MITDLVLTGDIDRIWPSISEKVNAYIEENDFDCSAGEMWSALRSGALFLIIAHDGQAVMGATIWKPETWVKGPVLKNIITFGENMAAWIEPMKQAAETLARQCGAKRYVWQGRRGWARHFPQAKTTINYIMEVAG